MFSYENPHLSGYMLTWNLSMFLETDGTLVWLYHCLLVHAPLHTKKQCDDRLPILYERQIKFVHPITRQTHPAAHLQKCTDRIKELFQFDMHQEDPWKTLTPGIVHQDRPAEFGPKGVSPVAVDSFSGSHDAGMYTRSETTSFWGSILVSAASGNALEKTLAVRLMMLHELTSLWTKCFCLVVSRRALWIPMNQLHMFWNTVESIFLSF